MPVEQIPPFHVQLLLYARHQAGDLKYVIF